MRALVLGLALFGFASSAYGEATELPDPDRPGAGVASADAVGRAAVSEASASLARFDAWMAIHPHDAGAASERCRFLDQIAYSEEEWADQFWDAAEACGTSLEQDFGSTLAAMAYAVETTWDENVRTAAERFFANGGEGSLYEVGVRKHLVNVLEPEEHADELIAHAQAAMRLDPEVDLSYELAGALKSRGDVDGAIRELLAHSGAVADPWKEGVKAKLLHDLGAHEASIAQFERATAAGGYVDRAAWMKSLEALGRFEEARAQLKVQAEKPSGLESAKRDALMAIVEFELDHGDAESVYSAYQTLRDEGYLADPFARLRIAVSLIHPTTPWQWRDGLGLLTLAGAVGGLALLPLLIFLPIHYVSLRRTLRDPTRAPVTTLYPLRRAWLGSALLLIAQTGALLAFAPDSLLAAWISGSGEAEAALPAPDLARLSVAIVVLSLMAALVAGWGRFRDLLGPGRWSIGKSLGVAIGCFLLLSPVARLSKFFAETIAQASLTQQMIHAVFEQHGAYALLAEVAVFTPIAEEILFRGVILAGVARHLTFGWANFVQAALFTLLHEELALAPFYLAFGLTTGLLTHRSGSLRAAMLLHAINNGLACLAIIVAANRSAG